MWIFRAGSVKDSSGNSTQIEIMPGDVESFVVLISPGDSREGKPIKESFKFKGV
jgi:hypothetical protein